MFRAAVAAIVLILVAALVAALYWYSRLNMVSMGGPVPLQSIPPLRTVPAKTVRSPNPAVPSARASTSSTVEPAASLSPPSVPRILSASLSSPVAAGGDVVSGAVQTTPDVTEVDAEVAGRSTPLTKVSAGYFALSYRVPTLPAFLRRTYTIVVTARNAAGRTASSSLPITIR